MKHPNRAPVLVWFRQDLRLADNPALAAAAASDAPVVALYVLDDSLEWNQGGASRWWLHHSLSALDGELQRLYGFGLTLRRGKASNVVPTLAAELQAQAVHWNRCYEPAAITRDAGIKAALKRDGIVAESHNAALLYEPWTVKTQTGGWFKVYSPFWRACRALGDPPPPLPVPAKLAGHLAVKSDSLQQWQLLPTKPDWAGGLRDCWVPGSMGAETLLAEFLDQGLTGYAENRDRPDLPATSRLSPHLHFGEIGPRQIWHATRFAADAGGATLGRHAEKFLSEIGWREFAHHLLYHFPDLPQRNFRADFDSFPWAEDSDALRRWQQGRTGYPIVDAGMRELWHTGWMHNRVRMIVASFLVKHLRQPWTAGEAWFWDTLVDADLANNAASWQWVAGSGADAAPYFRIFNPILQGERFDPDGAYVKHWVPELKAVPARFIHKPWDASAAILREAGVELGRTYPAPMVDHDAARALALAAFASLRDKDNNETGSEAAGTKRARGAA